MKYFLAFIGAFLLLMNSAVAARASNTCVVTEKTETKLSLSCSVFMMDIPLKITISQNVFSTRAEAQSFCETEDPAFETLNDGLIDFLGAYYMDIGPEASELMNEHFKLSNPIINPFGSPYRTYWDPTGQADYDILMINPSFVVTRQHLKAMKAKLPAVCLSTTYEKYRNHSTGIPSDKKIEEIGRQTLLRGKPTTVIQ